MYRIKIALNTKIYHQLTQFLISKHEIRYIPTTFALQLGGYGLKYQNYDN